MRAAIPPLVMPWRRSSASRRDGIARASSGPQRCTTSGDRLSVVVVRSATA